MHPLRGYEPPIYKVDIAPNHAWQLSFSMDGQRAVLLRVRTHKAMDRAPS